MVRRSTVAAGLALLVFAAGRLSGQSPRIDSLRQAIANVGGRAIVTLRSSRSGTFVVAPGSDPVPAAEMAAIQQRLAVQYPVRVRSAVPMIGALVATVPDSSVASLLNDPNVYAIEADVRVPLTATAYYSAPLPVRRFATDVIPWGVSDVGAPAAWAAGLTGAGVKVGIMDSGIDIAHPDLAVVGGYDFTTSSASSSAYNDNVASCGGHGTHVAGTVAALQNNQLIVGVAPGAALYALKVFEDDGAGCFAYLGSQLNALQWAVTNHLDVVSISIANTESFALDMAVANAVASNVVVVAAAGNNNGGPVVFPAGSPGAIAVAALDAGNTVAGYSNAGPEMWLAAPGTGIESTLPGGTTGYKSGTSMATPHVTGVVALLKQAHPSWTVAQIKSGLQALAHDIDAPGFDNATGWGLVQAPTSGGGIVPVIIAVSPAARAVSVQQGSGAPPDNAAVTLSGTNASTTVWSATKKAAWLTLTTSSGTGSGSVAWSRAANGLAVGTYVDTITVSATGVTGSPATVFDTLRVTPASIPVTMAVSPAARSVMVVAGTAAPADNAAVTLAGTNAASTAWSATKKSAWLAFTTASGTGSGTVSWNRNATGLAVGTYVDTITVTATGIAGSPAVVFDTLKVTAATVPVTMAVSPAARVVTVVAGTAAPTDNATVTLAGTNAAATAWSATKKQPWTTLTAASGTGSGTVGWSRNASGLAAGTYVDTITVSAAGVAGSPAMVFDTLRITTAAVPLVLAISPASRSASVVQGSAAPGDYAYATITGTNASATPWTASKRKSWTTLTAASGTGSGAVTWTRNASGLAAGTYVDTITVSVAGATGSPAPVIDTLLVTAVAVPIALSVSPGSRVALVQQGTAAPSDNATISLGGAGSASAAWTATKKKSWTTLTTSSGTGSGTVSWSRNSTGLGVGIYVDTITVSAAGAVGSPATVFDTLKITAAPVALTLAVSPGGRSTTVQVGAAAPADNASVTITGTNAGSTFWMAAGSNQWLTLTTAAGTGSGSVAWSRNASGLAVGVYVDTISVNAAGVAGPHFVVDTLRITAAPVPIVVAVAPGARAVSVQQGSAAPGDNAAVTLTGTNAVNTAWIASQTKPWITLASGSGTGSGTVSWNRSAAGLVAGTYVDTITVSAPGTGAIPAMIFDTLRIAAPIIPVTIAVAPTSRRVTAALGTNAPSDSATVLLTGTNSGTVAWSSTKRQSWTSLATGSGIGSGTLRWSRATSGLSAGTYIDTITISAAGSVGGPAVIYDTVQVAAMIAVMPGGREQRRPQFATMTSLVGSGVDSAMVEALADTVGAMAWTATTTGTRLQVLSTSGPLNSYVRWAHVTQPVTPGLYVDTVIVALQGNAAVRAEFIDSLMIVAVEPPATDAAISDLFDHASLSDDQRTALDLLGNANGHYDLGDFLAWVSRNHIVISASVSKKLQQLRSAADPPRHF